MGDSFLGIFLGPLFGYLADVYSLPTGLLVFQWTFVPLPLVGVMWAWKAVGRLGEREAVSEPA